MVGSLAGSWLGRYLCLAGLASWYPDLAGIAIIVSLCSSLPSPPCGPEGRTFHHPLWWIMNSFGSVFVRCIRKYSWYLTFLSHTLKHGFGQRNGQPAGMSVCLDTYPSGNCFPLLCLQTSKMCWTHNRCYRDLFSTKRKQLKCLKLNVNCSIRESWKHWTLKARIWNLFQRARAQLRTKADLKYFTALLWYANKTYLAKSDFLIALIKSLWHPDSS